MSEVQPKPWYKKWWGIVLTVLFFPVLLPYLLWTKLSCNIAIKIVTTVICLFFLIAPFAGQNAAKEEALELNAQAEEYLNEGKIDEALAAISSSKEKYINENENVAFALGEKIQKFQSDDLLKSSLVEMSDADFELLKSGQLNTTFIDHPGLNKLFIEKLSNNADKRATYLAEIDEQRKAEQAAKEAEQVAAEEKKRQEMVESQFSAWDGAHHNLTRIIEQSMNDPKSFEHVETVYWDMGDHLVVSETFRGKNAFGGVVKNTVKAKVALDGTVLEILEQY